MDLDFNKNEETQPVQVGPNQVVAPNLADVNQPASPTDQANQQPSPASQLAQPLVIPDVESNTKPISSVERPEATPTPAQQDQPVNNPGQLADLARTNNPSQVEPITAAPPPPPQAEETPVDEPEHQVIETQNQDERIKGSKVLPIIVTILVILILLAAGAWYYSANFVNQSAPTTIGVDPSTGLTASLDANGNPIASNSTDTTNGQVSDTTQQASADLTTITGRDQQRKIDLATIKSYLDSYKDQSGSYPISTSVEHVNDYNSNIYINLIPTYATSLPIDPAAPTYFYGYKSTDGVDFQLSAVLEDQTDPDGQKIGNNFLYIVDSSGADTTSSAAINNDFTVTGN